MMTAFSKAEREDLSEREKRVFRLIVEELEQGIDDDE